MTPVEDTGFDRQDGLEETTARPAPSGGKLLTAVAAATAILAAIPVFTHVLPPLVGALMGYYCFWPPRSVWPPYRPGNRFLSNLYVLAGWLMYPWGVLTLFLAVVCFVASAVRVVRAKLLSRPLSHWDRWPLFLAGIPLVVAGVLTQTTIGRPQWLERRQRAYLAREVEVRLDERAPVVASVFERYLRQHGPRLVELRRQSPHSETPALENLFADFCKADRECSQAAVHRQEVTIRYSDSELFVHRTVTCTNGIHGSGERKVALTPPLPGAGSVPRSVPARMLP